MFRISEERQASNERVAEAELDLIRALASIGDRHELTGYEEILILTKVLHNITSRHVREESP